MSAEGLRDAVGAVLSRFALLHELTVGAVLCGSRKGLSFHLLNNAVRLARYNRAFLWSFEGRHPKLLGVSGQVQVNPRAPLVERCRDAVNALDDHERDGILGESRFAENPDAWARYRQRPGGENASVLWLPVRSQGRVVWGVWFERFDGGEWNPDERDLLKRFVDGCGAAWARLGPERTWRQRLRESCGKRRVQVALILAFYVLFIHRVHLRVVAPCEVVSADPVAVTAPLDGVIDSVSVNPGESVRAGALLFSYDKRAPNEHLNEVRKDVAVVREQRKARLAESYAHPEALRDYVELEYRLQQEQTRLAYAEARARDLDVTAPVAGEVVIRRPHEWSGRVVRTGEHVLTIMDAKRTKLRIWVGEGDNVGFLRDKPVKVILNSTSADSLRAKIEYVSAFIETGAAGVPSFEVDAVWTETPEGLRPGLQGTAVLYGETVSVAYYLMRKPLGAVRRFLGI